MSKNHRLQFMASIVEKEKIKRQAQESGFDQVADYLRNAALGKNMLIEEKIIESNKKIIEINEIVKKVLEILENGKRRK